MKIYLGNKMTGIPYFNAPWFDAATVHLMMLPHVDEVFNPAQHDRELGLDPMLCPTGSPEESRAAGFGSIGLRKVLGDDAAWIAANSDLLIVGPDWYNSPGAIFEVGLHQALRLPCYEYMTYLEYWDDPERLERFCLPALLEIYGPRPVKTVNSPWRPWEHA